MRTWPALLVSGLPVDDDGSDGRGDLLQALLMDFDVDAIDESAADGWRVYFRDADGRDRARTAAAARFPELTFAALDVPDEDWAARSQASLGAVQVGRIIVAPPWAVPTTITILPSMGFGTGHHATTRLCLAALQRIDVSGKTVADIGTGSGVLAIAASLLGGEVTGIDDDPDAIQSAWDNLALNPGAQVSLLVGDIRTTLLTVADIVIANITGALLMASAEPLRRITAPGGRLILSGFQTHEADAVIASFPGFTLEHRAEEDGWVCPTLVAPPASSK